MKGPTSVPFTDSRGRDNSRNPCQSKKKCSFISREWSVREETKLLWREQQTKGFFRTSPRIIPAQSNWAVRENSRVSIGLRNVNLINNWLQPDAPGAEGGSQGQDTLYGGRSMPQHPRSARTIHGGSTIVRLVFDDRRLARGWEGVCYRRWRLANTAFCSLQRITENQSSSDVLRAVDVLLQPGKHSFWELCVAVIMLATFSRAD